MRRSSEGLGVDRRAFLGTLTGGLLAAPLAAEAQQAGKVYRVCFLALTPGEDTTSMQPLLERLHELGYAEGKNMAFEYRSAEGHPERLSPMARELVRGRPDVFIAGFGTLAAQAAKAATMTIPIVFTTVGDPVGAGLVGSLGRPGGNVTGLSGLTEIGGKHLQLLQELSPGKQVIAVLMNPETPFTRLALRRSRQPRKLTVPVLRSSKRVAPTRCHAISRRRSRPAQVVCSYSGIHSCTASAERLPTSRRSSGFLRCTSPGNGWRRED
jgi:hypothetical protein